MIKKLGNKGLLLILVLLLAVFGIVRYISARKGENTFNTTIIPKIDSARMNGMVIFPKPSRQGASVPLVFTRKGNEWYVSQGSVSGRAEQRSAHYMINLLEQISPDRLASNSPADWKEYNVNDSLGTRVVFLYDKDTALDMLVGRFSYIPQQRQGISYIRLAGHNEVYAIDGFLSMNITQNLDAWRDKQMMPQNDMSWTKLTFTYPADSGFAIEKGNNSQWVFADGKKPDSTAASTILKNISEQNYGSFINHFDTAGKQPVYTLRIEGNPFGAVVIKAYPADSADKYAIQSTMNPTSFFSGNRNALFSKIFPAKEAFFQKPAAKKHER